MYLIFAVDQPVNRPSFSAYICVCNASSNVITYQIDVSRNDTGTVNYSSNSLIFSLPTSIYNTKNDFYITFDAGVFFSTSVNSTARNDTQFWYLHVVDLSTSTSTTYLPSSASAITSSPVNYTDTSTAPVTSMPNNFTSASQNTTSSVSTVTAPAVVSNMGRQ